jgi:Mannosyltransferase (PIG-V)
MPSSSQLLLILLAFLLAKSSLLAIVVGTTFLPTFSLPFYHPPRWPFGYDTSSSLFLPQDDSWIGRICAGLWRWDAVYFVAVADRREYVWEQEWAFGPGWPALIRFSVPCNPHTTQQLCYFFRDINLWRHTRIPPYITRGKTNHDPYIRNPLQHMSPPRLDTPLPPHPPNIPPPALPRHHNMYPTRPLPRWSLPPGRQHRIPLQLSFLFRHGVISFGRTLGACTHLGAGGDSTE